MTQKIFPHSKAPATLISRNNKGVVFPIVNDEFKNCALLLKKMWPPKIGCEFWIECMYQKFEGAWVNANFRHKSDFNPDKI